MLAGALLEEAERLLDRGIHPIKVADGFDLACKKVFVHAQSFEKKLSVEIYRDGGFGKDQQFKCTTAFQALETLDKIADKFPVADRERLIETAQTSLGSKMCVAEALCLPL